jgi:Na+-transporting NADH:ubiquinone oxidoreductase subunit A
MSKTIKVKKGLDIRLEGVAQERLSAAPMAASYAVQPIDFNGIVPKLLVKPDDLVQAGSPLFFDKANPSMIFTSPVSGRVGEIVRGEKRKLLAVTIVPDAEQTYKQFDVKADLNADRIVELLLESGLWPLIVRRPYGIVPALGERPRDIFVSGFDSAPLAADLEFCLKGRNEELQVAVNVLSKLTDGKIYVGVDGTKSQSIFDSIKGIEVTRFVGKHPAGNVGVQIHHTRPISKGDVVWTIDPQGLATIGHFFKTGRVDMTRVVAVAGSEVAAPQYYKVIGGANIESLLPKSAFAPQTENHDVRIINGNPLTGLKVKNNGYLNFYTNCVTVIPEGNDFEFMGWIAPRPNKFSVSHSYFSWLMPKKRYNLNTNLNGGVRAYVVTGLYDKYLPMDIYPLYLLKACIAGDIDKMENLGIYEVIEEDFALCEFVDPSKTEMQEIIRQGINLMIKEN